MAGPKDKVTYTVEIDGAKAIEAAKEIAENLRKVTKAASEAASSLDAVSEAASGVPSPPTSPRRQDLRHSAEQALRRSRAAERVVDLATQEARQALQAGDIGRYKFLSRRLSAYVGGGAPSFEFEPSPAASIFGTPIARAQRRRAESVEVKAASLLARDALIRGDVGRFSSISRQIEHYLAGKTDRIRSVRERSAAAMTAEEALMAERESSPLVAAARQELEAAAANKSRFKAVWLKRSISRYVGLKQDDIAKTAKKYKFKDFFDPPADEAQAIPAAAAEAVAAEVAGASTSRAPATPNRDRVEFGVRERMRKMQRALRILDLLDPSKSDKKEPAVDLFFKVRELMGGKRWEEANELLNNSKSEYAKILKRAAAKQEELNKATGELSRSARTLIFRGSILSALGGIVSNVRQGLVEGVRSPEYATGTMMLGMAGGLGSAATVLGGGMFMRASSLLSPMALGGIALAGAGQIVSALVDVISARVQRGREVIEASTSASGNLSEAFGFLTQGEFLDTSNIKFKKSVFSQIPDTKNRWLQPYIPHTRAPMLSADDDGSITVEYTYPHTLGPGAGNKPEWMAQQHAAQSIKAQLATREIWKSLAGDRIGMTSDEVIKAFGVFSATPVLRLPAKAGGIYNIRDVIALSRMAGTNMNTAAQLTALQAGGYFRTQAPIIPPTNMGEIGHVWFGRRILDAATGKESPAVTLAGLIGAANYAGMRGDVLLNATLASLTGAKEAGLYGRDAAGLADTARFATSMAIAGVSGAGISKLISTMGGARTSAASNILGGFSDFHSNVAAMLALRRGPIQDFQKNLASLTEQEILEEARRMSPFASEMALQAAGISQADARAAATGRTMGSYLAPSLLAPFTRGFGQIAAEAEVSRSNFATQTEAAAAALERLRVEADKTSAWWSKLFSDINSNSYLPTMSGN